jgi:ParB family chromosome partitioning protein
VAVSMVLRSDELATAELRLVEPPIAVDGRAASAYAPAGQSEPAPRVTADRLMLLVDCIRPNPRNPRRHFDEQALDALADSIKHWGQLQPVVVRWSSADSTYELICGERRWRAHRRAGLPRIWAVEWNASDAHVLALALMENLQRVDLGHAEKMAALDQLAEITQAQGLRRTAAHLRIDPSWLSRQLAIRKDPDICPALEAGEVGFGQAAELLRAPARVRRQLLERVVHASHSVSTATIRTWVEEARSRERGAVGGMAAGDSEVLAERPIQRSRGPYGRVIARLTNLGVPTSGDDRDALASLIALAQELLADADQRMPLPTVTEVRWIELNCMLCGSRVTLNEVENGKFSATEGKVTRQGKRLVCERCGGMLVPGDRGTSRRLCTTTA